MTCSCERLLADADVQEQAMDEAVSLLERFAKRLAVRTGSCPACSFFAANQIVAKVCLVIHVRSVHGSDELAASMLQRQADLFHQTFEVCGIQSTAVRVVKGRDE